MATIRMSVSEIRRVGGWALRALGYSFGIAERAAGLIAWSEATGGRALRLLRLADARIAQSAALPAVVRTRLPTGGWTIEAGGKCLLEIGPPAIDLATTEARRHGAGEEDVGAEHRHPPRRPEGATLHPQSRSDALKYMTFSQ